MRFLVCLILRSTAALLLVSLVVVTGFKDVAQAQESIVFDIEITPQADAVVAGNLLVYTVTITNQSQIPVENSAINIPIPAGTKFVTTRHNNPKWYGGNPLADPTAILDKVTMLAPEAIAPGEVFVFDLVVEVLPDTKTEVVIDNYQVAALEEDSSSSGPPVRIAVTPAPTATPTPTAAFTDTPTATATNRLQTPTSVPTATSQPPASLPTVTPQEEQRLANAASTQPAAPTTLPDQSGQPQPASPASSTPWLMLAGLVVILVIIGVVWFIKK